MKKLLVLLTVLGVLAAASSASGSGAGSIVVSQVFAAGGNSGASYVNDYVELFNRGSSSVSITGWTLQYASATGSSWASTALSGSIPAGGHYLVQLASGGTNGAALPAPDATGTSNLATSGGKVQVVNAGSGVEDLVGWGSATLFEGSAAAPALSATTALVRADPPAPTPTTTPPTSRPARRIHKTLPTRTRRALRRVAPAAERRAAARSASTSSPSSPSRSTTTLSTSVR